MAKESTAPPDLVLLYTDGACSGNPGPGGWAYILKHPASGQVRDASGAEVLTTNNRMELAGVIEGLASLKRPCQVRLVAGTFDLLPPQAVSLVQPLPEFLLHGQSHLQGHGGQHLQEQRADGGVQSGPADVLADALGVLNACALTEVIRAQAGLAGVVADRHTLSAAAA